MCEFTESDVLIKQAIFVKARKRKYKEYFYLTFSEHM